MINQLQRASSLVFFAFVGGGSAVASAVTDYARLSPEEMFAIIAGFVVMLGGAVTFAFVRWLGKVERNVPRDPLRTFDDVSRMLARLDSVEQRVSKIDVRLGRIEGHVGVGVVDE